MTMKQVFYFLVMLLSANVYAGGNTLVFSNRPIDEQTGVGLPPATFDFGDKMYCRFYLKKDLYDYMTCGEVAIILRSGAQELTRDIVDMQDNRFLKSYEYYLNELFTKKELEALNNLPVGTHNIECEFVTLGFTQGSSCTKNIASGSFTLIKKADSRINKPIIGYTFNDVPAKMNNPALEEKALIKLKEKFGDNHIKLKILSEDWKINHIINSGAIAGRVIEVAAYVKGENDCIIEVYSMEQQYNGSGYQDSFEGYVGQVSWVKKYDYLDGKRIDCE